jgi:hypothetical protein
MAGANKIAKTTPYDTDGENISTSRLVSGRDPASRQNRGPAAPHANRQS